MKKILLLICLLCTSCATIDEKKELKLDTNTTSFVCFPADCNSNPPMIFGGKLLAEMDRNSAITVRRRLYDSPVKDYVTVAINNVKFHKAAEVKDLLLVTSTITNYGNKSITMYTKIERELDGGVKELIIDGEFIFVAYDVKNKKAVEHGLNVK